MSGVAGRVGGRRAVVGVKRLDIVEEMLLDENVGVVVAKQFLELWESQIVRVFMLMIYVDDLDDLETVGVSSE